jgi:type I restriction enzyme M protein
VITGDLKSRIDRLWEEFWTGGITNPLTVIEQITFLMFARLLDIVETRNENRERRTKQPTPRLFRPDQQHLRWSHFRNLRGEEMLPLLRDQVFPHFKTVAMEGATFGEYMKDAQLMVQKPSLLVSAVGMVEALPLTEGDTKGDLYEYLLSKLTTAGINGQFRTPRHIIQLMVALLDPKPTDVIGDPACGTGGFLVTTMEYLLRKYSSPQGAFENTETGEKIYTGDLLEPYREHIRTSMFHGFDFDVTMLRIASMNLLLHGVDAPDIHYQDTLSASFTDRFPQAASDSFDVVLANPPFTGSLDFEGVHPGLLRKVKTRKTELLFLVLMLRMLKTGGRCAVIVPDGVLFGSSKAHLALRQALVEENQLEAVISLPSGVFKPYAGVSTAILVFTKGGRTDQVWFYDVAADGLSLDDKRTQLLSEEKLGPAPRISLTPDEHLKNNLPDVLVRWREREKAEYQRPRTAQSFCVPKAEIVSHEYDLSLGRYKKVVHEEVLHRSPTEILAELAKLEAEIQRGMKELEGMLK